MAPILKIEDLSKRYIIRHKGVSHYSTLRETLSSLFKNTNERIRLLYPERLKRAINYEKSSGRFKAYLSK